MHPNSGLFSDFLSNDVHCIESFLNVNVSKACFNMYLIFKYVYSTASC